jgi:SAM-dependent methyltransferase
VAVTLSACPVCNAGELRRRAAPYMWIGEDVFGRYRGAFGVSECAACGFEFVNPRPTDAALEAFYGGDDYGCHDPATSDTSNARVSHVLDVAAAHTPGRRLLDYGCGAGLLLRCAEAAGWRATGYDVGGAAIASCRRQGLTVTSDVAELPAGGFDAIVVHHVLEHVTDAAGTLEMLRDRLAPGGCLVIECPNVGSLRARMSYPTLSRYARFDERYRAFPIHLSYFTPRTLSELLARHGFAVERTATLGYGVDELLRDPSWSTPGASPATVTATPSEAAPRTPRTPRTRRRTPLRRLAGQVLKRLILDTGLGENVMVVARRS